MLRRLIVLRHAKSSWKNPGQADHERPLNKRGKRDAPLVGAHLAELGWVPDQVISSDSQRTRETWARLAEGLDADPQVTFTPDLYLAGPEAVATVLKELDDDVPSAMVIGHNHGWEEVVTWLTGEDERMTTCNAALCSVEADSWSEAVFLAPGWTLHQVVRPKEL